MSRNPGYFARVWQRIRASFVIYKTPEKFIGQDHLGNRYYEIVKDEKTGIRPKRYFKAQSEDPIQTPDIPTEWNSWLRMRRNDPPTQEEVDKNFAMMMARQAKGRELEELDQIEAKADYDTGRVHRTEGGEDTSQFPMYSDYEAVPGVNPRGKDSR